MVLLNCLSISGFRVSLVTANGAVDIELSLSFVSFCILKDTILFVIRVGNVLSPRGRSSANKQTEVVQPR